MAGIQNKSDTCTALCALCTPTSACFGIYCYYTPRESQTNIATCAPSCSWYQLGHSCGHRDSNTLQVLFPHTPEEGREHSWAAAGWWSLHQGCSAHQQCLPCQDDDPGTHISHRASLFQTLYREKAPEGSGLHLFSLPVTILQFARGQCTHVSIQHPGKHLPCRARTANLSSVTARSITCICLFTEC